MLGFKQAADPSLPRSAAPSPDPTASPPSTNGRHGGGVRVRIVQRACATTVAHQVGHGRAAMLCFKCFWTFFRHVASLCFKCFSCFRCMFQLFHVDVAKVD